MKKSNNRHGKAGCTYYLCKFKVCNLYLVDICSTFFQASFEKIYTAGNMIYLEYIGCIFQGNTAAMFGVGQVKIFSSPGGACSWLNDILHFTVQICKQHNMPCSTGHEMRFGLHTLSPLAYLNVGQNIYSIRHFTKKQLQVKQIKSNNKHFLYPAKSKIFS